MKVERVLLAACVIAAACFLGFFVFHRGSSSPSPVTYPHGARCDARDPVTDRVCRAAVQLHFAVNHSQPSGICRHVYKPSVYGQCVKLVMFTSTPEDLSTISFNVLYARMNDGVSARVRVAAVTMDNEPVEVFEEWVLVDGFWLIRSMSCARFCSPSPAG